MKIFVTGASGFIGGAVATRLAQAGHQVRGLIRDPKREAELRAHGIEPVLGSLDDADLLRTEASHAEVVINTASSDHRPAIEALLSGLQGSGKRLIHTSGSSLVADEALGEPSDAIFDENTPIAAVADKKTRIDLDQRVLTAEGVHGIVLCFTLIYGQRSGPAARSVQLPALLKQAESSGVVRHVGRGLNRWSHVHIEDVASLFELAIDKAPAGSFYFAENGEASFVELTQALATAKGLAAPQAWPIEAAEAFWGREMARYGLGSNSRVKADKARRELGWAPQHDSAVTWILSPGASI